MPIGQRTRTRGIFSPRGGRPIELDEEGKPQDPFLYEVYHPNIGYLVLGSSVFAWEVTVVVT